MAKSDGPAQFMTQIFAQTFGSGNHVDRLARNFHAISELCDAVAEFEIVGVIVDQRFKAPDARKSFFAGSHGGAVSKKNSFQLIGNKRATAELNGCTEAIELRAKVAFFNASENGSDRADRGIFEIFDDHSEIVRLDADVAIAEDEKIVARFADEAHHFADFIAVAEIFRADEHPDFRPRKIGHHFLNYGNGRVFIVLHYENHFVFGIIQTAEAGVIIVCAAIGAADRLQNADGRREVHWVRASAALPEKEFPRGINSEKVVEKWSAGKRENDPSQRSKY